MPTDARYPAVLIDGVRYIPEIRETRHGTQVAIYISLEARQELGGYLHHGSDGKGPPPFREASSFIVYAVRALRALARGERVP